ncbi:MAG: L-threonylcarbamoyladenylate synthase [archaeon]|jgi:L-threonylcarbamoyladenylate synthase|nr:L-threonylcarbamoyladenylate synthase [archaeon]
MAKIVKIEQAIEPALQVLKEGGVIVYPTETSYGIGVDALSSNAVEKVHLAKKQPGSKPISVIVANEKQAEQVAELNENARRLIHNFMPGPLTLICKKREIAPKNLSSTGIAFRISSSPFAHELVEKFGRAITATSANLHNQPAIYSAKEAIEVFGDSVDLIVDADNLPKNEASTIYDSVNDKILREGQIKQGEILEALK